MASATPKSGEHFVTQLLEKLGVPVKHLVTDSRKLRAGDTFLAYAGENYDARKDIPQAIAAGVNAVIWEKHQFAWDADWKIPNCAVKGLQTKAGVIASHVYGHPSQKLWLVGITGTNGKTSCSHWYAQTMTHLGKKTAVIGTLGNGFLDALKPSGNTTPDAVLLQEEIANLLSANAACVAMEVSSHGLAQGRVNGAKFAVAVLTNLSRDHLDYHGSMDAYAAAKAKLFFWSDLQCAVLNLDDVLGMELLHQLACKEDLQIIGYGFRLPDKIGSYAKNIQLLRGKNLAVHIDGLTFDVEWDGRHGRVSAGLMSAFNASNLLAVLSALLASGIDFQDAITALSQVRPVAGRLERLGGGDQPVVIVDYAHTPDALEKVLIGLREMIATDRTKNDSNLQKPRLICVFGCGGDRDRGKRRLAGEITTRLADEVIITSDNPRSEESHSIIDEIVSGIPRNRRNYAVEDDRASAIYQAIHSARKGDVVLIAGKGSEAYQEIKGKKIPFDDREVARQVLRDLANLKSQALLC
ncbi:MAG TPA: UDP-N-acetylmuramoyl-L-alanyl-D-glutamate--2,6-diaminopimelate ligase [Nitrosomonas nitrosa]|uniref:UDP-N-acetylmuramoyl-L-alanyl-D-glutamate--2,6-diaminopimelate ligase n=1 Tax=Nitrosomonas nitrosa TaxID=52442 RepID=A0A1I4NIH2_9PROT|nr:UDP-N-acetylmuramoyl-L-alanyl-D-glutamate--2,6-diaminopimelate ligase [Nitrosomonas nitrosa]CAE6514438.1 UDP-N-acetylmuramoyl-L-alanyl-D-glutamate:meso-diaminopimelate ligase [Nitrosomonas nitrosa]SFM15259.1 UDP-N-acetylmuramoylalanyl-D-glutamate--2,6-diaminopimelate ligase [Nitrosomonas nitrosa]HNP51166.1 UDP-N-acetylmuramoyl-L-alanyl-D-glutamate--2,6-diaminopimelate ligase [Nitrosomonas nitrosa]